MPPTSRLLLKRLGLISAFCCLLFPSRLLALTPAGTLIFAQATATYFDPATGLFTQTTSNSIALMVQQVGGVEISSAAKGLAPQGESIQFPHIIIHTGNGMDTILLSISSKGAFIPHSLTLFDDPNENGKVDAGETPISEIKEMSVGSTRSIVAFVKIPQTAQIGQIAELIVTARSTVDPEKLASVSDAIEVSDAAIVGLSLSASPVGRINSGENIVYTLTAINTGIQPAEPVKVLVANGVGGTLKETVGFLLSIPVPANSFFVEGRAAAPGDVLLIYKVGGVWVDAVLPSDKIKVTAVGMILTQNDGRLLPAQSAVLTLTVKVLTETSRGAIQTAGTSLYQRHHTMTDVVTTNSNAVIHQVNAPVESVLFTDAAGHDVSLFHQGDKIYIKMVNASMNADLAAIESAGTISLSSSLSNDTEFIEMFESGENTGIFLASITFDDQNPAGNSGSLVWRTSPKEIEEGLHTGKREKTSSKSGDGIIDVMTNSKLFLTYENTLQKVLLQDAVLIDPSGVVFNSITNEPISGVSVTLVDSNGILVPLVSGKNPVVTGVDGQFSFEVPAGSYRLALTHLPAGFSFPSMLMPSNLTPMGRTIDPLGSYGQLFEATAAVTFDLPADPPAPTLFVQKSVDQRDVEVGDLITYTVQIKNNSAMLPVTKIQLFDSPPLGISYLAGSATCAFSAVPSSTGSAQPLADPSRGRPMVFEAGCASTLSAGEMITITYQSIVGPGALMGDGINRASAVGQSAIGAAVSNTSSATIHIVEGVFTDRAILIGKVFLDLNGNGEQDGGEEPSGCTGGESAISVRGAADFQDPCQDEPGVPGVRLIMEDGTSVTTDSEGKYSIYGLRPTTHVLKVDPMTLPDAFKLSDRSTRSAGDPNTLFVDLMPGELHRANFAISPIPPSIWEPIIEKRKKQLEEEYERTLGIVQPAPILGHSQGVLPAEGTKGKMNDVSSIGAGGRTAPTDDPSVPTDPDLMIRDDIALPAAPNGGGLLDLPRGGALEKIVSEASIDLAIVSPDDQEVIPIRSTNVIATGFASFDFRLIVNDQPVDDRHVGEIFISKERPVAAIEWIAVPLDIGQNAIKIQAWDSFGNMRAEILRTVFVPGDAETILIEANPASLPADGTSTSTVTIRIVDRQGYPVSTRSFLTVSTSRGHFLEDDLDPSQPGLQIAVVGGETKLQLVASDQVGDAMITAGFGDGRDGPTHQIMIPHLPALREIVASGLVDAKINLRNFKGKIQPVTSDDRFAESLTGDGRAALYLKGKVAGSTLLTLAYDSDKPRHDPLFRDIQPDQFYPIYGDDSVKGFDAQSTGKLYLKVEQGKSYLLWGDFSPDFIDHELLTYQRALSGLKYHREDDQSALTLFHNQSQQKQVVERIAANGTSGFYQLTHFPIVENSEIIELITVDRERPEIVIKSQPQIRFVDYTLDTVTGRILFKTPISSLDPQFNPIFIKVTYETSGAGRSFDTYGIDGKIKWHEQFQTGGTLVHSNEPGNPLTLYGIDLRAKLFEGMEAKTEIAQSDSILEGAPVHGTGFKVALSFKPNRGLDANTYWLKTDATFQNRSANLAPGKTESGIVVHYKLREGTLLRTQMLHSNDQLTNASRSVGDLQVDQALGVAKGEAGLKHIQERHPQQRVHTDAMRLKFSAPFPNTPELTGMVGYEWAWNRNADIITLGSDYQMSLKTKMYGRQEWATGAIFPTATIGSGQPAAPVGARRLSRSVIGIDSSVFPSTTVFSEYRMADAIAGRENQAAMGLRNRYLLAPGVTVSSTFERTDTLRGNGSVGPMNQTAFSSGFEHLARRDIKGTTRYEIRNTTTLRSQLWSGAAALKATDALSLLGRETLYTEDRKGGRDVWSSRLVLGAALRPSATDRIHLLSRYEFKYESEKIMPLRVHVVSVEGNIKMRSTFPTLFVKYANRIAQFKGVGTGDGNFHSTTQMLESRITHDLTPRIDLGLEVRHIVQHQTHAQLWGYAIEGGYAIAHNVWLSGGFQINGLDQDDFTDDRAVASGIYFRMRYKFDEEMVHFLRGEFLTLKGMRFLRRPLVESEPAASRDVENKAEQGL